jgi:hypothetical protein
MALRTLITNDILYDLGENVYPAHKTSLAKLGQFGKHPFQSRIPSGL